MWKVVARSRVLNPGITMTKGERYETSGDADELSLNAFSEVWGAGKERSCVRKK